MWPWSSTIWLVRRTFLCSQSPQTHGLVLPQPHSAAMGQAATGQYIPDWESTHLQIESSLSQHGTIVYRHWRFKCRCKVLCDRHEKCYTVFHSNINITTCKPSSLHGTMSLHVLALPLLGISPTFVDSAIHPSNAFLNEGHILGRTGRAWM